MTFSDIQLSSDGFLGGRLTVLQPRDGYRAATDPVLLAAACPARPGERVLELGCGAGVASLCLGHRVAGLSQAGIELQPAYAALARRNAAANGIALQVHEGDLARMPAALRAETFDHVIANPPYYARANGTAARDAGRETALREQTPLADWMDAALRRLAPGGWLTVIHEAQRLPDLLAALPPARAGSIRCLPLAGRAGAAPGRVILRARKGGRGAFALLAPLILHDGARHAGDRNDFTATAESLLRDGAALDF
ncbi:tRNA1(Val) (adenine(37)-N6)-methyltransferase [Frigidibacter sp. MR17.24]|uniref:tRNA1(Val) (adenine(37)-N6)-methyltransferase n=1 Tax=Frigidibacter sp. MR17.24 TaxID=3127345 RepID=UPI003012AAD9